MRLNNMIDLLIDSVVFLIVTLIIISGAIRVIDQVTNGTVTTYASKGDKK
jgi:hypothetical protein